MTNVRATAQTIVTSCQSSICPPWLERACSPVRLSWSGGGEGGGEGGGGEGGGCEGGSAAGKDVSPGGTGGLSGERVLMLVPVSLGGDIM